MDPIVEIRELSVAFAGRTVLDGLNLDCHHGEITVLVGHSGSGKTTLLRAINRLNELFPECTTNGTVRLRLDGAPIDVYRGGIDVATLRRRAGMVFQTPNVLPVSIERNFAIPLHHVLGLGPAQVRERMERSLVEAELFDEVRDRLHQNAQVLSGGQQQRLCLARALALEPSILLLDEPTASLDFRATAKIEALLLRLKTRYTIVAVSHGLGQTCRLADRCVVLSDGRISEVIDGAEVREESGLRAALDDAF